MAPQREATLTGLGYTEVKTLPAWDEVYKQCKGLEKSSKQHAKDAVNLGIGVKKISKSENIEAFKPILNVLKNIFIIHAWTILNLLTEP